MLTELPQVLTTPGEARSVLRAIVANGRGGRATGAGLSSRSPSTRAGSSRSGYPGRP